MESSQNYMKAWEPLFLQYKSYLTSFTFRMTGSLAEAEEIVQDALLECAKINPGEIDNHKSWLTKICSNKALDLLKSAYKNREVYPGPWLPDAIPEGLQDFDVDNSVEKNLLLSESLTTSFLLILEKLTPEERAVYLLSEVFEYSFKDISSFIDKSEASCRKIAQRAREAVTSGHKKFVPSEKDPTRVISQFFDAAKSGDVNALANLLSPESEFWSDGGGKVLAATRILRDQMAIARFFAGVVKWPSLNSPDYRFEFRMISDRPGLIISKRSAHGEWAFETLMNFEIEGNKIARIYSQRNPDKLRVLMK